MNINKLILTICACLAGICMSTNLSYSMDEVNNNESMSFFNDTDFKCKYDNPVIDKLQEVLAQKLPEIVMLESEIKKEFEQYYECK